MNKRTALKEIQKYEQEFEILLMDLPQTIPERLGFISLSAALIYVDSDCIIVKLSDTRMFEELNDIDPSRAIRFSNYTIYPTTDLFIRASIDYYWDHLETPL